MAHERTDQEYSRIPTLKDLILVCKLLNDVGAKYVVIGGFAMMHHGMNRTTEDIGLLVDDSEKNIKRIKRASVHFLTTQFEMFICQILRSTLSFELQMKFSSTSWVKRVASVFNK